MKPTQNRLVVIQRVVIDADKQTYDIITNLQISQKICKTNVATLLG